MKKVSPYKTKLCEGNAYWMARLSKEVYLTTSDVDQKPNEEEILKNIQHDDPDFLAVFGFDGNSAQAAVIEHKDYICLAFRGTNETKDWIDNINAFSVKALFGEFHRGFYNSVEDLWHEIEQKIDAIRQERKKPLFITGHSLGGAMASIAASILIHEDKPFTSVYTFGQPRALTQSTSRIFNIECKDRYYRFHNNNDIVTRSPTRLMGYSHVGTYLYITAEGEIHQDVGQWFKFVDYIDGAIESVRNTRRLDLIKDHDMANYLRHIQRWNVNNDSLVHEDNL